MCLLAIPEHLKTVEGMVTLSVLKSVLYGNAYPEEKKEKIRIWGNYSFYAINSLI